MGQAIAEVIDSSDLTTRDMAKEVNFAEASLCRWKNDERAPHVDTLADIEEAAEKPLGTILIASGYVDLEQVGWYCPETGDVLGLEWGPSCNGDTVEHDPLYRLRR